jgi:hypothetical protein
VHETAVVGRSAFSAAFIGFRMTKSGSCGYEEVDVIVTVIL